MNLANDVTPAKPYLIYVSSCAMYYSMKRPLRLGVHHFLIDITAFCTKRIIQSPVYTYFSYLKRKAYSKIHRNDMTFQK